ncbi:hypothetical protein K435DRAFT_867389 [Dendrothele bispora CBS 962.96]|uniref:Uncharacterized protein n=1 Tax=Dendrothele bispora (strain CBS 962.96) TaxID=1314807 RepID=A0A4S8LFR0_DENBC|nr:hypothetical protein K435DRAFT_867389 [Dendrothele bispora CBS 962.96]
MTTAAGLPTPPLSSDINRTSTLTSTSSLGASALDIDGVGVDDSSDLDLERYTLTYPYSNSYFSQHSPINSNSSSSSPPPPPISGHRLFFDTCTSSNLNHTPTPASSHAHDLSSPIRLDPETSAKATQGSRIARPHSCCRSRLLTKRSISRSGQPRGIFPSTKSVQMSTNRH